MKAWEIVFGWNDGNTPPTEAGTYYVATFYEGSQEITISTFDYTVEYGWNTSASHHDHAITFEHKYWWTPAVRIGPDELMILRPSEEVVG